LILRQKHQFHFNHHPFETSEFSIAWAKDHILELQREIADLVNDEYASTIFTETSSNGIWEMIKFKLSEH